MLRVNNRNTSRVCEICSKFTINTPERRQQRRFSVFIVNFEHISHFLCFSCQLLTAKCFLVYWRSLANVENSIRLKTRKLPVCWFDCSRLRLVCDLSVVLVMILRIPLFVSVNSFNPFSTGKIEKNDFEIFMNN